MLPCVGLRNLVSRLKHVVLPAPFGPIRACMVPRATCRLTPLTATNPAKSLVRSSVWRMISARINSSLGRSFSRDLSSPSPDQSPGRTMTGGGFGLGPPAGRISPTGPREARPFGRRLGNGLRMLKNLEDLVDQPLGQPVPDADCDDAVEPAILRRRRLEKWRDPQIVVRRLDHLTAGNAVEHLFRAMAHAAVGHADDL